MEIHSRAAFNDPVNHAKVEIYNSGYAQLDVGWSNRDTAGSMCHLYFIEEGTGCIETEGCRLTVRPGMACFIPAGVSWRWETHTAIRKFFVDFNLVYPMGDNAFATGGSVWELPCSCEQVRQMVEWYGSGRTADWFSLKAALYAVFARVLQDSSPPTAVTYSPPVADTIRFIHENVSMHLTPESLAQRQFVSRAHLSTRFRKEVGIPIGQYIDQQVLVRCRIELERGQLTVAQISQMYGFCDQFYFSKFFKKHMGESPSVYRRRFVKGPTK